MAKARRKPQLTSVLTETVVSRSKADTSNAAALQDRAAAPND
jgi:hypothetical protein